MRTFRFVVLLTTACAATFLAAFLFAQEGPDTPSSDSVAKPRKPATDGAQPDNQQTIPSEYHKKDEVPEATFSSNATTVSVDVAVLDNKGRFIPNIPAGNFRVLEDNVPQKIETSAKGEAPMTVCLLIEFSARYQWYGSQTWQQTLVGAYGFAQTLKKDDYIAVIAYDMKPEILSDFSTDRTRTYEALQRLRIPGFSESNLYDALVDTEERMENIEGRKAIVLLSSGVDTFSKLTFDQARKRIQEAAVPVFAISLMQALRIMADPQGPQELTFLQADNQMKTFARETGGQSFYPRFYGEFPDIFQSISDSLRNEYTFTYHPTNQAKDGTYRHIKVELVNPATNEPLRVVDAKQKPIKYQIIAKQGYKAPHEVD
jgi:Ca-activated chloride channel homolog